MKGFHPKLLSACRGRRGPSSRRQLLRELSENGSGLLIPPQGPEVAEACVSDGCGKTQDGQISDKDALDRSVMALDLSTKSGQEAALRYLSNEQVIQEVAERGSLEALRKTIEMVRNDAALSMPLFWGSTKKFKKFIFVTGYALRVNVVYLAERVNVYW
jgi:hypothetical protein